jgi:hypothetical protein
MILAMIQPSRRRRQQSLRRVKVVPQLGLLKCIKVEEESIRALSWDDDNMARIWGRHRENCRCPFTAGSWLTLLHLWRRSGGFLVFNEWSSGMANAANTKHRHGYKFTKGA